jgi:hypothetical protein
MRTRIVAIAGASAIAVGCIILTGQAASARGAPSRAYAGQKIRSEADSRTGANASNAGPAANPACMARSSRGQPWLALLQVPVDHAANGDTSRGYPKRSEVLIVTGCC